VGRAMTRLSSLHEVGQSRGGLNAGGGRRPENGSGDIEASGRDTSKRPERPVSEWRMIRSESVHGSRPARIYPGKSTHLWLLDDPSISVSFPTEQIAEERWK